MKVYYFLPLLFSGFALGSVINNVRLVNHVDYVIEVITKMVQEVERREWCTLKLPDLTENVDEQVLEWHALGTIHYTNGFVVSIQEVDIQQSTVQQVWTFNTTDDSATVSVRGSLRIHSLAIGYDVVADLADGSHRYTMLFTHPLITYAFSINKNIHRDEFEILVVTTVPNVASVRPVVSPQTSDYVADFLVTHFNGALTANGINDIGQNIFVPLAMDIVKTQVQFPDLCYNCPA